MLIMADRWVVAYDVDDVMAESAQAISTIYNRIRATLASNGFSEFTQLSVYSMPDEDNALVRVYQALQALGNIPERKYIKRLHVFKIDGALNDVLPIVDKRYSAPKELE
jgi:virulence-associated protein VapD